MAFLEPSDNLIDFEVDDGLEPGDLLILLLMEGVAHTCQRQGNDDCGEQEKRPSQQWPETGAYRCWSPDLFQEPLKVHRATTFES